MIGIMLDNTVQNKLAKWIIAPLIVTWVSWVSKSLYDIRSDVSSIKAIYENYSVSPVKNLEALAQSEQ